MFWNLIEAAMTDQGASDNAVLLLTGLIDPLLKIRKCEWQG